MRSRRAHDVRLLTVPATRGLDHEGSSTSRAVVARLVAGSRGAARRTVDGERVRVHEHVEGEDRREVEEEVAAREMEGADVLLSELPVAALVGAVALRVGDGQEELDGEVDEEEERDDLVAHEERVQLRRQVEPHLEGRDRQRVEQPDARRNVPPPDECAARVDEPARLVAEALAQRRHVAPERHGVDAEAVAVLVAAEGREELIEGQAAALGADGLEGQLALDPAPRETRSSGLSNAPGGAPALKARVAYFCPALRCWPRPAFEPRRPAPEPRRAPAPFCSGFILELENRRPRTNSAIFPGLKLRSEGRLTSRSESRLPHSEGRLASVGLPSRDLSPDGLM